MGHGDATPSGQQPPYPPTAGAAPYPPPAQAGPYPPAAGAAPYLPAQPNTGMTAPGGYPVASPGAAGPSSGAPYPPGQPYPSAMEPPKKPQQAGGMPPPAGYPGAGGAPGPYPPAAGGPNQYPPPGGYPPQGSGPAPGYPVMGTHAAPIGGMSVEQGGVPQGQEPCGCSPGWVLFGIGFIFWPCWVAAAFVPLCTRNRNDRLAGLASTVAMLVLVVIAIILGVTSRNWRYY